MAILGKFNPAHQKLVVVGGGFSGLLLAYRLKHLFREVHLVEKSGRLGGLIQTIDSEHGMYESGPHSMRMNRMVESLFQELGVPVTPLKSDGAARFIVRDGRLRKLPLSLAELFKTVKKLWRARATLKSVSELTTLEEVGLAALGQAFTERVMSAATLGIYGATPGELSAELAKPFFDPAQAKAKKAKGPTRMMAPANGMESLIEGLELALKAEPHVTLHLNASVSSLEKLQSDYGRGTATVAICTDSGTAALLTGSHALKSIRYVGLASLSLVLKKSSFKKVPRGVGFLSPPQEQDSVLGVLFPSSSFNGRTKAHDTVVLTVLFGGTVRPDLVRASQAELTQLALDTLDKYLGLKDRNVVEAKLFSWPSAIPLYAPGFIQTLQKANEELGHKPGLLVFGNYTGQVSLRGLIETLEPLKQLRKADELADFSVKTY